MPAITVRNLSLEVHTALKQRAKLRGTSAEAEVRAILDASLRPEQGDGLGTKLHRIFRKHGYTLPEIKRDQAPIKPASFE